MSTPRILSIVGASADTQAHLRLMLRIAGSRLEHPWELQDSKHPDLVIIESDGEFTRFAVQQHCKAKEIPLAVLCDQDEVVVHGMALRQPLKLEQLVAVLNAASSTRDAGERGGDTTEHTGSGDKHGSANGKDAQHLDDEHGDAFDRLVRNAAADEEAANRKPLVDDTTELEPIKVTSSARRLMRHGPDAGDSELFGVNALELAPIADDSEHSHDRPLAGNSHNGSSASVLADLLQENAILSPTLVTADNLPDIVLDPKPQCYYSTGPLDNLLPYAKLDANALQTSSIAGSELQRARGRGEARPLDELRWLLALATSNGHLNPELDRGGSYSIENTLKSAPELRSHHRIVALMATPMPLHEIARASGAKMEDVFDIVNAYHAIGRITYIPRKRLQDPSKSGMSGIWDRLKGK